MLRATIKGLLGHKTRLLLTSLAIVVGVGFVAGTYIFTDTIDKTFSTLFDDVYSGVDVVVHGSTEFAPGGTQPPPFDESVLADVLATPGVSAAEGSVSGYAQLVDKQGKAIQPMGPPTLGVSWPKTPELQGNIVIRDGRAPQGPGEITIDARTAKDNDLAVGDVVEVLLPIGHEQFEIVGTVGFGDSDNLAGATITGFELNEAQRVLDQQGRFGEISVLTTEGESSEAVAARLNSNLAPDIVAVTAADQSAEQASALSDSLGFIQTVLLVFALVAVFVGAFIIQNTFRIIVAQRTRELGLMRAVGATAAQVVRMVVLEAIIVSVIASIIGIGFGFVISQGLTALMSAIGFDLPATAQQLALRTIIVGMVVGVVVTVLSALLPAIKAARIPPIAALREAENEPRTSLTRRTLIGGITVALGVASILIGLIEGFRLGPINGLFAVGIGVLVVFIGTSILSVLFIEPLARIISAPITRFGKITGRLARENSIRRPRRTAATASALMIGLALVGFFFILGDSIKKTTGVQIEEGLRADFVVGVGGFAQTGFSPEVARQLASLPEIGSATELRMGFWDRDGSVDILLGIDTETVDDTVALDITQGSLADLSAGGVFVFDETARDNGWKVGDTIPMGFAATGLKQVPIVGVFARQGVIGSSFLTGIGFFEQNFAEQLDIAVAVKTAPGVSTDDARLAIDRVTAPFPNIEVKNQAEFRASQEQQVNSLLALFNGLLALAVIIALMGITNTLVLSVLERTREVGLLRAVGLSRRQTRRMVLWESIIVAVIGGVFGIVLGVFFGVVLVSALGSQGIDHLSIPAGQLGALLVFSGVVGVIAGLWPARKAARLNILEAIAYE